MSASESLRAAVSPRRPTTGARTIRFRKRESVRKSSSTGPTRPDPYRGNGQNHDGHPGAGMTQRIVFLDRSTLQAKVRAPAFEHTWQEYPVTAVNELPERLRDATIAITNKVPLRAETLQRLRKLKMIAVAATGYDVIDIPYCKANGIAVTNIRNYAVHTVPEHAFTLITALRRNLLAYCRDVDNGRWQLVDQFCFFDYPIRDLYGATLGIIGEGALRQATAHIARGFGRNVLFADHAPPQAPAVVFAPL